jgi:hypothetical protein
LKLARRWLYQGLVRIQAFTICADRCISPFAADLFIHCRGLFKDIFTEIVKNIPLVPLGLDVLLEDFQMAYLRVFGIEGQFA